MVRTDVVDVDSDGGVCANAVLLHEANQLALCQVVWWGCLALHHHVSHDFVCISLTQYTA